MLRAVYMLHDLPQAFDSSSQLLAAITWYSWKNDSWLPPACSLGELLSWSSVSCENGGRTSLVVGYSSTWSTEAK
jgi:hypothetical protein